MHINLIRALFYLSAAYDGSLALIFIFAPGLPFFYFETTPPNHLGYVQFPAALLLIFAVMFLAIARQPARNSGLIPYGILLKVAYCGVAGGYWYLGNLPAMWMPFFFIDFIFMVAYIFVYRQLTAANAASRDSQAVP